MDPALSAALGPIARDLRLGASASALSAFAEFITALTEALPTLGDRVTELMPLLEVALAAQERADYLGLADVLEYELMPPPAPE